MYATSNSVITVSRPNWIKIYGRHYNRYSYLLYDWQEDDLPQFVQINDSLVIFNFILLYVQLYTTLGVNDHILGYLINRTHHYTIIYLSHSFSFDLYHAHRYFGDMYLYICMRSFVENTT